MFRLVITIPFLLILNFGWSQLHEYTLFEDYEKCLVGLQNHQREIVLPAECQSIKTIKFNKGFSSVFYLATKKNGLTGVLGKYLDTLVPFSFQHIESYVENPSKWLVQINDKWGVIDTNQHWVIMPEYDQITLSHKNWGTDLLRLHVLKDDGIYLADCNGNFLSSKGYTSMRRTEFEGQGSSIPSFTGEMFRSFYPERHAAPDAFWNAREQRLSGILDSNGVEIIPTAFNSVEMQMIHSRSAIPEFNDVWFRASNQDSIVIYAQDGSIIQRGDRSLWAQIFAVKMNTDKGYNVIALLNWREKVPTQKGDSIAERYKLKEISSGNELAVNGGLTELGDYFFIVKPYGDGDALMLDGNLNVVLKDKSGLESKIDGDLLFVNNQYSDTSKRWLLKNNELVYKQPASELYFHIQKKDTLFWFTFGTPYLEKENEYTFRRYRYNRLVLRSRDSVYLDEQIEDVEITPIYEEFRNIYDLENLYSKVKSPVFVKKKGKFGGYDPFGKVIIPFEYEDFVKTDYNGYILAKDGKYGMLNRTGEVSIPFIHRKFTLTSAPGVTCYNADSDTFSLYKKNGELILSDCNKIYPPLTNAQVASNLGEQRYINRTPINTLCFVSKGDSLYYRGKDSLRHVNRSTFPDETGDYVMRNFILSKEGAILRDFGNQSIYKLADYFFIPLRDLEIYKGRDKVFTVENFSQCFSYDGELYVEKDYRVGILREDGFGWKIKPDYRYVYPESFTDNYWAVQSFHPRWRTNNKDIKYLYLDANGAIIPFIDSGLDTIFLDKPASPPDNNGLRLIESKFYYGLIDAGNNVIVDPKYSVLIPLKNNGWYAAKRETWSFFHKDLGEFKTEATEAMPIKYSNRIFLRKSDGEKDYVSIAELSQDSVLIQHTGWRDYSDFVADPLMYTLMGWDSLISSNVLRNNTLPGNSHEIIRIKNQLILHQTTTTRFDTDQLALNYWNLPDLYEKDNTYRSSYNHSKYHESNPDKIRFSPHMDQDSWGISISRKMITENLFYVSYYWSRNSNEHLTFFSDFKEGRLVLSDIFKDDEASLAFVDSYLRDYVKTKQIYGISCPNLDEIVQDAMREFYMDSDGIHFPMYQGRTVIIKYEEIEKSLVSKIRKELKPKREKKERKPKFK